MVKQWRRVWFMAFVPQWISRWWLTLLLRHFHRQSTETFYWTNYVVDWGLFSAHVEGRKKTIYHRSELALLPPPVFFEEGRPKLWAGNISHGNFARLVKVSFISFGLNKDDFLMMWINKVGRLMVIGSRWIIEQSMFTVVYCDGERARSIDTASMAQPASFFWHRARVFFLLCFHHNFHSAFLTRK